jgi:hypothetical protein
MCSTPHGVHIVLDMNEAVVIQYDQHEAPHRRCLVKAGLELLIIQASGFNSKHYVIPILYTLCSRCAPPNNVKVEWGDVLYNSTSARSAMPGIIHLSRR